MVSLGRIELEGDFSDLLKEIDKTDQELRELLLEITRLSSQVDFDPASAEFQYLSGRIKDTGQRLDELQGRVGRAGAELVRTGKIGSQAIRDFSVEFGKAEQAANKLQQEINDTGKRTADLRRALSGSGSSKIFRELTAEADRVQKELTEVNIELQKIRAQPGFTKQNADFVRLQKVAKGLSRELNEIAIRGGIAFEKTGRSAKGASAALEQIARNAALAQGGLARLQREANKTNKILDFLNKTAIRGAQIFLGYQAVRITRETIQSFIEFTRSVSTLGAVSQATAEELDALKQQAFELGAQTEFTTSQVVEAQTELARAGLEVVEVQQTIGSVLNIATVAQVDASRAAEVLVNTLRQFNLDASESARVADTLVGATINSAQTFDDLAEALKVVGPAAATVGQELEETSILIAALANNGIKGSQAGTQLRRAFLALASPTEQAKEALRGFGVNLDEISLAGTGFIDVLEQLGRAGVGTSQDLSAIGGAADIFQERAVTSILALSRAIADSEGGFDRLRRNLLNLEGSVDRAAAAIRDNLAADLDELKSTFESVFFQGAEDADSFLRGITQLTTEFLRFVGEVNKGANEARDAFAKEGLLSIIPDLNISIGELNTNTQDIAGSFLSAGKAVAQFAARGDDFIGSEIGDTFLRLIGLLEGVEGGLVTNEDLSRRLSAEFFNLTRDLRLANEELGRTPEQIEKQRNAFAEFARSLGEFKEVTNEQTGEIEQIFVIDDKVLEKFESDIRNGLLVLDGIDDAFREKLPASSKLVVEALDDFIAAQDAVEKKTTRTTAALTAQAQEYFDYVNAVDAASEKLRDQEAALIEVFNRLQDTGKFTGEARSRFLELANNLEQEFKEAGLEVTGAFRVISDGFDELPDSVRDAVEGATNALADLTEASEEIIANGANIVASFGEQSVEAEALRLKIREVIKSFNDLGVEAPSELIKLQEELGKTREELIKAFDDADKVAESLSKNILKVTEEIEKLAEADRKRARDDKNNEKLEEERERVQELIEERSGLNAQLVQTQADLDRIRNIEEEIADARERAKRAEQEAVDFNEERFEQIKRIQEENLKSLEFADQLREQAADLTDEFSSQKRELEAIADRLEGSAAIGTATRDALALAAKQAGEVIERIEGQVEAFEKSQKSAQGLADEAGVVRQAFGDVNKVVREGTLSIENFGSSTSKVTNEVDKVKRKLDEVGKEAEKVFQGSQQAIRGYKSELDLVYEILVKIKDCLREINE